jgi:dTDP-4-dehydrorhamnose 3,5-epimerase-like enzyme
MTDFFAPGLGTGLRWNDPAFGIAWPLTEVILSERDASCPDFDRAIFEEELARRESGAPT